MIVDNSQDWKVWDNLEGAVLRSRRQAGDYVESPVTLKRRKVLTKEMMASGGVYTSSDRVWLVPAVLVDTGPIKPADQIQDDDGGLWTVLEVDLQSLKSIWRCVTRNLAIQFDLQDLITVEAGAITYDAAGGPVKTWAPKKVGDTTYQNLPARVQPQQAAIVDERGLRGLKVPYEIVCDRDLAVTNDDRVSFGGQYYEIRGWRSAKSIEDLFVIEAELLP